MSAAVEKINELDVINAERGVWLVKVPKYMANEWQKGKAGTEIGKLKINKNGDKTEIIFDVADSIVKDAAKDSKIPKLHKFAINDIPDQHLAVFSHTKDDKGLNKTVLEGTVLQKGECRPIGGELYMGLKRQAFEKAQEPKRQVIALDRAVNSFKPVSVHIADLENEKKKKAEGKKSREDKDKVVDMIMTAFQKHQYYGLKDLVRITNQPVGYLKEILSEFCKYNQSGTHKSTWELKPEYRHYEPHEPQNNDMDVDD